MKKLLLIILIVCMPVAAKSRLSIEDRLETTVSNYGAIAYTTNAAITAIIEVSTAHLQRIGRKDLALQLKKEWRKLDGRLIDLVVFGRDIGWYKPLIEWLSLTYETIELAIGYEAALAIRLSDLKTINHGIIVVFRPCYFGENEFKKHFIHDKKYRGFAPVITYWTAAIACTAALHGAGYYFVCSPGAMVLERVMDKKIAPKVAPKLYNMACSD